MAKIYSSTMDLKAIFKSTAKAPLDNRQVVQNVADLYDVATWDGFAYDGMLVIVQTTGDAYILKDSSDVTLTANWIKLANKSETAAATSEVKSGDVNYLILSTSTAADGHTIYTLSLDHATVASGETGLADASDVKTYVDASVSDVKEDSNYLSIVKTTDSSDNHKIYTISLSEADPETVSSSTVALSDAYKVQKFVKKSASEVKETSDYLTLAHTNANGSGEDGHNIYTIGLNEQDPETATAEKQGLTDAFKVQKYVKKTSSVVNTADKLENYISVNHTNDGTDGHNIYTIGLNTVKVSEATAGKTGLVDANDVKTYVDTASAKATTEVKVKDDATEDLAITTSTGAGNQTIYTIETKKVNLKDATNSNTGLVDAYDAKTYVDNAIIDTEKVTASALNELSERIDNTKTASVVTLTKSTPDSLAAQYTISQGGKTLGTIDIPKDMVVQDGKVVDVTYKSSDGHYYDGTEIIDSYLPTGTSTTAGDLAGKYIKLTIANKAKSLLYIAAEDLVDAYSSDVVDTNNVNVIIDKATNKISAEIGGNSRLSKALNKVDTIEPNAEVNIIEIVKVDGVAQVVDSTDRSINITTLAHKDELERVEKVTSASLNDLNGRVEILEYKESQLPRNCANSYLSDAITTGTSITIPAATHECGIFPLVQVYFGYEIVTANVSVDINNHNDVTVAWEITPSESTPIRIRIVG